MRETKSTMNVGNWIATMIEIGTEAGAAPGLQTDEVSA